MDTSARMLRLLSLLQTTREWTGGELAERLEVSPRTVRKDVERLRGLGYPVHASRGAAGGYRLGAGTKLPPLLLDDEEAVAVAVGLRAGTTQGSIAGIEESSLRALAKLEQVLPSRLRRRVSALQHFTVPVPRDDSGGPAVDADILSVLVAACRDHEQLRFDYRDHSGDATRRRVEPYRAVSWGRRWFLVAFDVDRDDWRTFRVDRIGPPRIPYGPRFTPREPPAEDIAVYVSARVAKAAWRYQAAFTVRAPAAVVAARIHPAVGTVEALDEHTCVLHSGSDSVLTMAVYIGTLGLDFTVDGPPELLDELHELVARYQRALGLTRPPRDRFGP